MNITYPLYRTRFSSEPIDISKTLGGVSVTPSGTVKSAKAWLLIYQLRQQSPSLDHLSTDFQSKITQLIYSAQPAPNLTIHHYHSTSFDQELDEGNKRIAPKFTLTITILIVFSILCTFTVNWTYLKDQDGNKVKGWLVVDWRASKPILGICGVVYTLMAIVTAIGILLFFDVTFVDMCVVMPFLSLTIGIDDTFLLLASWHETNRTLPYQKRMEDAIKHAGVSIGITSLTDSLAFLIGSLAPLPAVIYFCYYSSVAILFIFIYSMTFFLACLSLQGKLEEEARHCLVPSITTESFRTKENDASSIFSILLTKGYSSKKVAPLNNMWYQKFFQNYYSKFITTGIVQFCGLIIYLAYIYITITGIQQIKIGFDITNIVQDDSPVKTFFEQKKKLFSDDDTMIDVAILRAPNLAVKGERELFFSFLNQIEGTFCSAGRNTTDFWFFGYKEYFKSLGFGGEDIWEKVINDANNFGKNLKPFFMSNDKYNYDVLFKKGTTEIVSFRLSTQLKVLKNDAEIIECTKTIRNICSKYKDSLVPFTYTLLWNLSDQFEVIWPQTMQDLYISICVMIIVSLLFIPQPFCALAIAATIGSIGFGVLGWMTWWDVNLDATSMITIAMSVGFSVDFAAHATYSFISCKREGKTPEEQLSDSLAQIGWPISQGSISVLLGISMLATVKTYVVETCFKTVFLVILFGMLHALFFLPIILLNLTKLFNLFSSHKHIISPA
uniref:SSD domain-containing protein n=1 Tax=Rhabditophanes sp. KR3021 TaxID=114890 RepID=A0AC35U9U6_9BILA